MNNKQYELIGESIWNTYRSLGALIEARLDPLSLASRKAADTEARNTVDTKARKAADTTATQATNTKTYKKQTRTRRRARQLVQARARREARNAAITPEGISNYLAKPGRPDRKRWGRVSPERTSNSKKKSKESK